MIKKYLFVFLLLIIVAFTLRVNYYFFNSMIYQSALMYEYNANKYSLPISIFDDFDNDFPNITQTTIPIKFLKARYLYKLDSVSQALNLLHDSRKANPYLMASEALLANIYLDLNILDSAKFYSRKAFYNIPDNNVHRDVYFKVLRELKDSTELKNAFNKIRHLKDFNHWLDYLLNQYAVVGPNNKDLIDVSNEFDKSKLESLIQVERFEYVERLLKLGALDLTLSGELALEGENKFIEKEYEQAAFLYEQASKFDPLEYTHLENAGISYNLSGDGDKAKEYLEKVIKQFNPKIGKSEFYLALILIKNNDFVNACTFLNKSIEFGYGIETANNLINEYCKK